MIIVHHSTESRMSLPRFCGRAKWLGAGSLSPHLGLSVGQKTGVGPNLISNRLGLAGLRWVGSGLRGQTEKGARRARRGAMLVEVGEGEKKLRTSYTEF